MAEICISSNQVTSAVSDWIAMGSKQLAAKFWGFAALSECNSKDCKLPRKEIQRKLCSW